MKIVSYRQDLSGIDIAIKRAVLWPCFAYNITVPIQKEKDLNIFEETVLKMIYVETSETEKLTELLSLKPQLIEFIKARLVELNLISTRFELTEIGLNLLDKLDNEENEYEVVTIFVNRVSGELFPVVIENFEVVRDYTINGNKVIFRLGSAGNSREIWARKIRYNLEYNNKNISSEDVINTVHDFRKLYNRFSSVVGSKIKLPKFAKNMGRLTINQKPEEIYIHCNVLIQKGNSDFLVTDPFGFDFSTQLTKDIQCEDNEQFLRGLRDSAEAMLMKEDTDEKDNDNGDDEWSQNLFAINELNKYQTLKRHLKKVEENYQKSKEKVNNSDDESRMKHATSEVIQGLYKVMESILKQVEKDYPSDSSYKDIFSSQSAKINQKMLENLARKIGFTISDTKSFLHLQPTTVASLNNGIIRPELMAALALSGANENANHPFFTLAANVPYFFDFMKKLQGYRNSSAHGSALDISIFKVTSYRCNKCNIDVDKNINELICPDCSESLKEVTQLDKLRDIVYLSLRSLYPSLMLNNKSERNNFSQKFVLPNQDILKAKKGLDRNFSLLLINKLKENQELYDQLIKIEKSELDIDNKANVYVNSIYSTLQLVLDEYNNSIIKEVDLDKIRSSALQNAKNVGFQLDKGRFTKELSFVGRNKIKDVLKGKPSSLGASLLLFLALETKDRIRFLQESCPSLILDISLVLKLRDHGDKSSKQILDEIKDKKKLIDLKESAYEIIKKIKEK